MSAHFRFILILILVISGAMVGPSRAEQTTPRSNEVWVNPGIGFPAPTAPSTFMADVTVAFIGTLEQVAPEFLDSDNSELATRLVFRPIEFIKRSDRLPERLDVWAPGGSYLETGAGKKPYRADELVRDLEIGALFFVPATLEDQRLWLTSREALVELKGDRVIAAARSQRWVNAVVAHGQKESQTPGPPIDARGAFIAALKVAVTRR
jgi:hypothetical protein